MHHILLNEEGKYLLREVGDFIQGLHRFYSMVQRGWACYLVVLSTSQYEALTGVLIEIGECKACPDGTVSACKCKISRTAAGSSQPCLEGQ